jgi:iron(III) transport system permease protein
MGRVPIATRALPWEGLARTWRSAAQAALQPAVGLSVLVALALGWLLLAPLGTLIFAAFREGTNVLPFEPTSRWTLQNFLSVFTNPVLYRRVLLDTALYTLGSCAVGLLVGTGFAWLVERTDLPGRHLVYVALLVPLLVPPIVVSIGWVMLLGPRAGLLNVLLRALMGMESGGNGPLNIFSMWGMILVQGFGLVPLVFVLMASAFRNLDWTLEEAAWVCGASQIRSLVRVVLPMLFPAVGSVAILSLILTLESFEVPLLLGVSAGVQVYSTWIYYALNPAATLPNYGQVAALALPGLLVGMVGLWAYNRTTRLAERYAVVRGKGFRGGVRELGRARYVAIGLVGLYLLVTVGLPVGVLIVTSLFPEAVRTGFQQWGMPKLDAYRKVLTDAQTLLSLRNGVVASAGAAVLAVGVATGVAWVVTRTNLRGRFLLDFLAFSSVVIPGVILALAVMLVYLWLPVGLYGTLGMLVVAFAARTGTVSRILRTAMLQVHRELEEAAWVSGCAEGAAVRRILIPLVLPAVLAAWVFHFVISFREFTVGLVLYRPETSVAAVRLWHLYERGDLPEAGALGTVMLLGVVVMAYLARRLSGRWGVR